MFTALATVAGGVRCSWSQARIVGLCFPAKNNKCIVERIILWTVYRETYRIVTKAYCFTPTDLASQWRQVGPKLVTVGRKFSGCSASLSIQIVNAVLLIKIIQNYLNVCISSSLFCTSNTSILQILKSVVKAMFSVHHAMNFLHPCDALHFKTVTDLFRCTDHSVNCSQVSTPVSNN